MRAPDDEFGQPDWRSAQSGGPTFTGFPRTDKVDPMQQDKLFKCPDAQGLIEYPLLFNSDD